MTSVDYSITIFVSLWFYKLMTFYCWHRRLQKLLWVCEQELDCIDMSVNVKNSCCIRIGARHEKLCSKIKTLDGRELEWVDQIRYLGVYIVRAMKFKCSIDHAKRSFYRAANSIFAKVDRLASEEVIVQLLKQKCLPVLLYALEVCNLDKKSMNSLDFTLNRFFMKLRHLIWRL